MASVKSLEAKKYVESSKRLIKSITKIEENEENFEICLDFIQSNLLYHSFTSVNSHEVNRIISGLYEKFLIHSDLQKASSFKTISEKLLKTFNEKPITEKEQGYSILALLLHLSESGDGKVSHSESVISNYGTEESTNFDWTSYLREDDIDFNTLSDNSIELISSEPDSMEAVTSEDDSVEDLPRAFLRPPPRDDSGIGVSPDSCSGTSPNFQGNGHSPSVVPENLSSAVERKRNPDTFYPYWIPKYQRTYGCSPYNLKTMNFTKIWEEHLIEENPFVIIERKVVLHERNVVKEVLWMLSGIKDLYVVMWNGSRFVPNSHVHLCNLTSPTLSVVLNEFCEYGTKRAEMDQLTGDLSKASNTTGNCLTYEAYIEALQKELQGINDSIYNLDKMLRRGRETFTLLILRQKIKTVFNKIDTIHHIHKEVFDVISDDHGPFEKSCRLIHTLWRLLYHQSLQEQISLSLKIILRVFLRTCKPFITFLEELTILGSFKDHYEEFVVARAKDISLVDEVFWEKGFTIRSLPADMEKDFFIKPFLGEILSATKSLAILNKINALLKKEPFRLYVEKGDLYSKFVYVLHRLVGRRQTLLKSYKTVEEKENVEKKYISKDPLLEEKLFNFSAHTGKFFCPDVNPVYTHITWKPPEKLFTQEQETTYRIIENFEPVSLKPLHYSIQKALGTCMRFAYYPTCRRLMNSLREDHQLMVHINAMRKYFLMESGDVMFSFYSELFEKIFYNEPWQDVSFLYSALQNAIWEDKENCQKLCLFLDTQNSEVKNNQPLSYLNVLQLSYEVQWPVSIMLGVSQQNEYCQIFSYLLQIKCAKYILDELYCTSLSVWEGKLPSKLMKASAKSIFPRQQKVHGMYILRMRLMFFVNGLHNYIMTRILHSFGVEFSAKLETSKNVDDMIFAHNSYLKSLHERCLLDRRLAHIKEPIFQVLNLCYTFQQLWLKGVNNVSLEELEDIENQFSKYSNFLFCCFNAHLRRGTYIHLENLVSTMLSKTHSLHVFGNNEGC